MSISPDDIRFWIKFSKSIRTRVKTLNFRARKFGTKGELSVDDIIDTFSAQNGMCFYCHDALNLNAQIDHVQPISQGGLNVSENIVLTCTKCNSAKHDRRYPGPVTGVKLVTVMSKVSPDERQRLTAQAGLRKMTLSAYIRSLLIVALRESEREELSTSRHR